MSKRSIAGVLGATAVMVVGLLAVSPSVSAKTTGPFVPVPPTPTCASGGTPIPAVASRVLADGGYAYDFVVDGQRFESRVPPSSFNPLTASDSALAYYGFPSRPQDSSNLANWRTTWSNFKAVTLPSFCRTNRYNLPSQQASSLSAPQAGTPSGAAANSFNWAGIVSYNATGYVAVQGDWPQSHVHNCGCGTTDTDESTWSGLGGWVGSQALLQEGTSMQGTGTMFAWYEYLHACPPSNPNCNVPELEISGLAVSGGMPIHTYTAYQTSNNQADFLVCANGVCRGIVQTLDSSYYDGRYAEQIDERPTYCNASGCFYKPVTNFLYNDWTNLKAETTGQSWVNEPLAPGWAVTMENSSSQTLVHPTAFGTSTMTDTWVRAQ